MDTGTHGDDASVQTLTARQLLGVAPQPIRDEVFKEL
jgi:hypothetical protein